MTAGEANKSPLPWKATLCLTYVCNLHCTFCDIWERRPKGELTFEEWETILRKAPRFRWVDLTGGEPTVRKDFHAIMEAVIGYHDPMVLHFPTNGSFPDRLKDLEKLTDRARIVVTVSIDGPRELHDTMRGTPGSFDKCVESLNVLRSIRGVKSVAGMTLTAENESAVDATRAAIAEKVPGFSMRDLHVNLAQVSEHYYGNSTESFQEARKIPEAPLAFWPPSSIAGSLIERRYRALLPKFIETRRCPIPCRSLTASVFVSPMGLVHPCITDPRVAGSLREFDLDLKQLLLSDGATRLRRDVDEGKCPHCWTPCEAYPTILEPLMRWVV